MRRPIPILPVQNVDELARYDLLFWAPALDQTISMTKRHVCRMWPDATLYTIVDRAGLSRVYAAQVRGSGWTPAVAEDRWSTSRCGTDTRTR